MPEKVAPSEDLPRKVYVELTADCDQACVMCPRHSWSAPGGAMSEATFATLLAQLKASPSIATVNFSGYGEPTGHPRFHRCLREAKDAGLAVEVVTNGSGLDAESVERLIDLPLDKLIVSIDGIAPGASEMLHAGSFDRVSESLRKLYHRRLTRREDRPVVAIEFVATKRNVHELPTLVSLARALGVSEVLVSHLIPPTPELAEDVLYDRCNIVSRRRPVSPWSPRVDLPQIDPDSPAADAVDHLRRAGTHLTVNGQDVAGAGPACRFVLEGRFAVCWDGEVSPCLSLMHTHSYVYRGQRREVRAYHLGNIRQTPLATLWDGEEYRDFRDRVRRFAFSPCIDCGGCDLRADNEADCLGGTFPRCGECLWAAGLIQCP